MLSDRQASGRLHAAKMADIGSLGTRKPWLIANETRESLLECHYVYLLSVDRTLLDLQIGARTTEESLH